MTSKLLFLSLAAMALLSANAAPDRFGWQKEYLKLSPALQSKSPNFELDCHLNSEIRGLKRWAAWYKTQKNYPASLIHLVEALHIQLGTSETCHLYNPFNIRRKTEDCHIRALIPLMIYLNSETTEKELQEPTRRSLCALVNDIVDAEILLLEQHASKYLEEERDIDALRCFARILNNGLCRELLRTETNYLYERYQLDEKLVDEGRLNELIAHLESEEAITKISAERRSILLNNAFIIYSLISLV